MEIEMESETETETESKLESETGILSPTRLEAQMEKETEASVLKEKYYKRTSVEFCHMRVTVPEEEEKPSYDDFIMSPESEAVAVENDPDALDPSSEETKSAVIWDFQNTMSTNTMLAFMEKLFGNEDMQNLVYLCLTTPGNTCSRLIVVIANLQCTDGPSQRIHMSIASDDMQNPESPGFPQDLQHLTSYGCTSCGSKIYIAGGMCEEVSSDKVFVFNTGTKTWETTLRMNTTRGKNPSVIAANDNIFIFGGGPECHDGWAEVYNPADAPPKSCQYLPPFPNNLDSQKILSSKIISHAVHPKGTKVLLLLDFSFVLAFNYSDMSWNEYEHTPSVCKLPMWNKKVVVFEGILFWHNSGTILAHDLLGGATIPIYTLPRSGFSKVLFDDDKILPSFLARIGRRELCLFFQSENYICYATLLIQVSRLPGTWTPLAVLGDSGIIRNTLGHDIMHALEVSLQ